MRFNERQLFYISSEKADYEGRLHFKKVWANYPDSKGFKQRWFKLKYNILFYFKLNETRQLSLKEPTGLFILEDSHIQLEDESETPFAFSIVFKDDFERKYLFAGRSENDVADWIRAIKGANYGNLRSKLICLQEKIKVRRERQREIALTTAKADATYSFHQLNIGSGDFNQASSSTSPSTNLIEF